MILVNRAHPVLLLKCSLKAVVIERADVLCVNLWKRFYINTSVSEDNNYEDHIGMVSEDGVYGDNSGRLFFTHLRGTFPVIPALKSPGCIRARRTQTKSCGDLHLQESRH